LGEWAERGGWVGSPLPQPCLLLSSVALNLALGHHGLLGGW
jgi:hypothetical protein